MLAKDQSLDLGRRHFEFLRDERAEPRRVQHGSQSHHLVPRQTQPLHRQLREDVHRVGNHKNQDVPPHARRPDALEDLRKQRNIPVDQVQPRFVRLPPQPRRDQEHIAIGRARVIARVNPLVGREGGAMQEIQRFALRQGGGGIEQLDFADNPAALQRKGRAGTHAATAANDRYFHRLDITSVAP